MTINVGKRPWFSTESLFIESLIPLPYPLWSSGQPLAWLGPKRLIEHKLKGTYPWLIL